MQLEDIKYEKKGGQVFVPLSPNQDAQHSSTAAQHSTAQQTTLCDRHVTAVCSTVNISLCSTMWHALWTLHTALCSKHALKTHLNQVITLRNCFRIRPLSCVKGFLVAFHKWTLELHKYKDDIKSSTKENWLPLQSIRSRYIEFWEETVRAPLTSIIGQTSASPPRKANVMNRKISRFLWKQSALHSQIVQMNTHWNTI